jgi:mannitol-specific phosphotransferase system IIBC component
MKFIASKYDENTGWSTVTMQHLGIKFNGAAKVHPDEVNPSKYAGCRFAEMRATLNALKYERKLLKNKADMALDFVKSLECYAGFDKNSDTAKYIYKQLNKRIEKVNKVTDEINNLQYDLDVAIHQRDMVTKALERKKNKKD